jgi:hypothetical protein
MRSGGLGGHRRRLCVAVIVISMVISASAAADGLSHHATGTDRQQLGRRSCSAWSGW